MSRAARKYHGALKFSYFIEAARRCRDSVGEIPIVIFSDDQNSAEELSRHLPNSYIQTPDDGSSSLDVLATLSLARAIVISNSTFGWWGAWSSEANLICAPRPWFLGENYVEEDLIPEGWLVIDGEME